MNSPQLVNTAAQAHHSSSSSASSGSGNNNNSPAQTATANKFAPARRLAARQTLRLAIPKQQGDSVTLPHAQTSNIYRHSPSQLPPAPLLKRHTSVTAAGNCSGGSNNSFIPKSASPLESHKLPNVTPTCTSSPLIYNGTGGSASSIASNSNFLGVRKPSLTLNSSDIRNNNDLFAFAKDMSPALELSDHSHSHSHSPMFTDISTAISPANSNGSPTHHQLGRLFSLSPSSMRSYGNVALH
ncbi:hypothetical protein AWZ03_009435 [Drosophila navojoa]|uniref:Uncharacterized protein n=1 Tax=Drosophila navojoa TaxID=7232 RepID=A0A484B640_DRONA|nr:hypothetical protein AWZ03_009435 [Drosophila navojoa]